MRWEIQFKPRSHHGFSHRVTRERSAAIRRRVVFPCWRRWPTDTDETVSLEYSDETDLVVLCEPGAELMDDVGTDISRLIPHRGSHVPAGRRSRVGIEDHIVCRATSHRRPDNPLRDDSGLRALCGIEYGAQAIATHAALLGGLVRARRSIRSVGCRTRCHHDAVPFGRPARSP